MPESVAEIMKKYFYGIQKKLLLYSASLIVAMVLVFVVLILRMFVNEQVTIKNQYTSMTENMLLKFDSFYNEMNEMTQKIIADRYIQSYISKKGLTITERETLERVISDSSNSMSYFFVNDFGEIYSNRSIFIIKKGFRTTALYKKLDEDYAKTHLIWLKEDVFGIGDNMLYVGRNVQSINKIQREAKIYFPVSREYIVQKIPFENYMEQINIIFSEDGAACFVQNEKDGDVDNAQKTKIQNIFMENRIRTKNSSIYMINKPEGILYAGYHAASGFTVCTFISRSSVNHMIWETFSWLFFVLLIGFLIIFFLSVGISNYFSAPIRTISGVMDDFGMDALDKRIEIKTNTELDRIGNAYNEMLGSIKGLLGTIQTKEKEVREMELESLLYQINPHFLYNTLDNIYMLARMNQQIQIMEMVDALARFLRITLSNGKDVICLKQELEHVCAYMNIQKIRNSDLFLYELSCPKELESYLIPKMILQPLVENCIEHGFPDMTDGGRIGIAVCEKDRKLTFTVCNNGETMDEKQVEKMNGFLKRGGIWQDQDPIETSGGYGVGNVIRRLKLKYGDSVFMQYYVRDGCTSCRIEIEMSALEKEVVM